MSTFFSSSASWLVKQTFTTSGLQTKTAPGKSALLCAWVRASAVPSDGNGLFVSVGKLANAQDLVGQFIIPNADLWYQVPVSTPSVNLAAEPAVYWNFLTYTNAQAVGTFEVSQVYSVGSL